MFPVAYAPRFGSKHLVQVQTPSGKISPDPLAGSGQILLMEGTAQIFPNRLMVGIPVALRAALDQGESVEDAVAFCTAQGDGTKLDLLLATGETDAEKEDMDQLKQELEDITRTKANSRVVALEINPDEFYTRLALFYRKHLKEFQESSPIVFQAPTRETVIPIARDSDGVWSIPGYLYKIFCGEKKLGDYFLPMMRKKS